MSANIGINIRNARKALHLSQEALGEMIGAFLRQFLYSPDFTRPSVYG